MEAVESEIFAVLPLDKCIMYDTANHPQSLIPWLLICSYAYYHMDVGLISDSLYDSLCKQLHKEWDGHLHKWKGLITPEDMHAGSLYALPEASYPNAIKRLAMYCVNGYVPTGRATQTEVMK